MLIEICSYVQSYAEVIKKVTGVDVEIVDKDLLRIAGTGIYSDGIGKKRKPSGRLYQSALKTCQTLVIRSPKEDRLCKRCLDKSICRERFCMATPIVADETVIGVIGLVCFDDEETNRLIDSLNIYVDFIGFLANALAHKVEQTRQLNKAALYTDLLLKTIDAPGQGVILFEKSGKMIYINTPAKEFLSLPDEEALKLKCIQATGNTLYGMNEFEVKILNTVPDSRLHLYGNFRKLDDQGNVFIFVFEIPERLTRMAMDMTDSGWTAGFESIIGQSSQIKQALAKALKVSTSSSTVLISGESGTGKELFARAIHQAGPRKNKPFVAINCGGIPENLLESELFGYAGGAFTGASSKGHMGKFELAQGGVVFLDEVSSLPIYLQVKLLRLLQERVVVRLGSNNEINLDVRIIAATNEDLRECVRKNTFREDLYYRLNVIPLTIPPLRQRPGDSAVLATFFLDKYCRLFNKRKTRLKKSVLKVLTDYTWPGNVRELEHVIEYAVNMMDDDGRLGLGHLPEYIFQLKPDLRLDLKLEAAPRSPQALSDLEQEAIKQTLDLYGFSTEGKKQAAKALGISLATLYRKMKYLRIHNY